MQKIVVNLNSISESTQESEIKISTTKNKVESDGILDNTKRGGESVLITFNDLNHF